MWIDNLQCNHLCVYSKASPTEFYWICSQENMYRITDLRHLNTLLRCFLKRFMMCLWVIKYPAFWRVSLKTYYCRREAKWNFQFFSIKVNGKITLQIVLFIGNRNVAFKEIEGSIRKFKEQFKKIKHLDEVAFPKESDENSLVNITVGYEVPMMFRLAIQVEKVNSGIKWFSLFHIGSRWVISLSDCCYCSWSIWSCHCLKISAFAKHTEL